MKPVLSFALALFVSTTLPTAAQEMKFNWMPGNFESIQLDPVYYHAGHVYRPGSNGGNMHIDINSEKPVTVAHVPEGQWGAATRYPERLHDVNYLCRQE